VDTTVVRGICHTGSITLVYGKPKSGKSFLATDLALAVAETDRAAWMSHAIKRNGVVLYVACEGHGGFWKRLAAVKPIPSHFVLATGRPVLIASRDGYQWSPHVDDVVDAIEAVKGQLGSGPVLVVIDTVFRSFGGGNVNDSVHMNAYVGGVQALADAGMAVILVHHATKSSGSPAGSVALMGAADTLILVEKHVDNVRSFAVEEAKDDADAPPRAFRLELVDGITDAAGEAVSSCKVVDLGEKADQPKPDKAAKPDRPEAKVVTLRPRTPSAEAVFMAIGAVLDKPDIPEDRFLVNGEGALPSILRDDLRHHLIDAGLYVDRGWLRDKLASLVLRGDIVMCEDAIAISPDK
jgi:hypothetical protein